MSVTVEFPAVARTGFKLSNHHFRQARCALFLSTVLFILPMASVAARPPGTGGGKPPPTPQILPVSLGAPADCASTEGTALNNGAFPGDLVVTAMTFCPGPDYQRPYFWQAGSWNFLGGLSGVTRGTATGVSNDGKVVGYLQTNPSIAFVVESGDVMESLPLLADMSSADATGISDDGNFIFGNNGSDTEWVGVRWSLVAGNWSVEEIGAGGPVGSSDDGSMAVGNAGDAGAWIWTEIDFQQWLGAGFQVNDISPAGDMIVGFRCGTTCEYPDQVPVYWIFNGGSWEPHDLASLGGPGGAARGVGLVNGKLVIVGYGYTAKEPNIARALAWFPQVGGGYLGPIRLAALGGKSRVGAWAEDVNEDGIVLGESGTAGLERVAVLWTLPTP